MLLNPNHFDGKTLKCVPGTRILEATLGAIGHRVRDPYTTERVWTIHSFYLPVKGRAVGGIRARLVDNVGFTTFCNQRDLEVLLGHAKPGDYCSWLGKEYVGLQDSGWLGFALDDEDLIDDLYDRELLCRTKLQPGTQIPQGTEINRNLHNGHRDDYCELLKLHYDGDAVLGLGPDTNFLSVSRRWLSIERTPAHLRNNYWQTQYHQKMTI